MMQKIFGMKEFIEAISNDPDVPTCIQKDVKRVFLESLYQHEMELEDRIDWREYKVDEWSAPNTVTDLKLVKDIIAILEDMPEC
jgi:hypothetical protein